MLMHLLAFIIWASALFQSNLSAMTMLFNAPSMNSVTRLALFGALIAHCGLLGGIWLL